MTSFHKVADCIYQYVDSAEIATPMATDEMKADFTEHGYIVVKNLLSSAETGKLRTAFETSKDFWTNSFPLKGETERTFDQTQWKDPGKDILGRAVGSTKTVGVCEQLLNEGELYMYSGKVIMKKPHTGGSLIWHQDYGYWYNNAAPFPHFITCILALTQSDRHNGGVQVIEGSHRAGRLDHGKRAGQTGADIERVRMLQERLSTEYADLAPGDAVIFHANTLHRSDENVSENKRWNLIFSYNAAKNDPGKSHYNNCYNDYKLHRFDAHAIKECDSTEIDVRPYLDPKTNININLEA